MFKLFIDVDGVILIPRQGSGSGPLQMSLKEHVDEFIIWATSEFDCYWLTGWAPNGHMKMINDRLLPHLPPEASNIKVAIWSDLKTEAISNGDRNWIWIDDNLLKNERAYLESINCLRNFILIDPQEPSLRYAKGKIEHVRQELMRDTSI